MPLGAGDTGVPLPVQRHVSIGGQLSVPQTVIALSGMACATVLAITGHISGDAVVALVSSISGHALGYINGKKAGRS